MVDNFALLVSQLMMIVVLWRCFTLPEEGEKQAPKQILRPKRGTDKGVAEPKSGD